MIRNRILYAVIIMAMLLFLITTMSRIAVMGIFAFVLFPPVSLALSGYSMRRLLFVQNLSESVINKGEETEYRVSLRNRSPFPMSGIKCGFDLSDAFYSDARDAQVYLAPMEKGVFSYTLRGRYRGFYEIGITEMESLDFLGMFRLRKKIPERMQISVYPRIINVEGFPLWRSLMNQEQSRRDLAIEDYEEISDVREYRESDPIKKIHWKLSARFDNWIVKNYQTTAWDATAIIFDVTSAGMALEDRLIEIAVGLGCEILRKQRPVTLIYGENGRYDAFSMQDFSGFYSRLAQMEFTEYNAEAFPTSFLDEHLQGQSINMIVVTSEVNENISANMLRAREFGHFISLAYVRKERESKNSIKQRLYIEEAGIDAVVFGLEGEGGE